MKDSKSTNSRKTKRPLPMVSEWEEKTILSSINAEAASFMPDQLLGILKACGVSAEVDNTEESFILRALGSEKEAFTPDVKLAIEKATGVFDPFKDKDTVRMTHRVRKEGQILIPDVKDGIFDKTGVKVSLTFGAWLMKRWLMVGGSVTALAAVTTGGCILLNQTIVSAAAAGSYISISITPSTYDENDSSTMIYQESPSNNDLPENTNKYKPAWSITTDNDNLVKVADPDNYSASLVAVSSSSLVEQSAYQAVANLINPCYEKGYLEAFDKSAPNSITINVFSTMYNYANTYEGHFKESMGDALQRDRIYADVEFNVVEIDPLVKKDPLRMGQIMKVYTAFDYKVDANTIAHSDEDTVSTLVSAIKEVSLSRLSDTGLSALMDGISESFLSYAGEKPIVSNLTDEEFEDKKYDLLEQLWRLNRYFRMDDWDKLADLIGSNSGAVYISDLSKFMSEEDADLASLYASVRNHVLADNTIDADTYHDYLERITSLGKRAQKSTGYFPDIDAADPGKWSHGQGTYNGDWGDGGYGFWGPGPWGYGPWGGF